MLPPDTRPGSFLSLADLQSNLRFSQLCAHQAEARLLPPVQRVPGRSHGAQALESTRPTAGHLASPSLSFPCSTQSSPRCSGWGLAHGALSLGATAPSPPSGGTEQGELSCLPGGRLRGGSCGFRGVRVGAPGAGARTESRPHPDPATPALGLVPVSRALLSGPTEVGAPPWKGGSARKQGSSRGSVGGGREVVGRWLAGLEGLAGRRAG